MAKMKAEVEMKTKFGQIESWHGEKLLRRKHKQIVLIISSLFVSKYLIVAHIFTICIGFHS